jgi:retrograde regulation protein 2
MKTNFIDAYKELEIPVEVIQKAKDDGGFTLYLSGGGFRGWGYLLLYQSQVHGHSYPISLIKGFSAQKAQFENTESLKEVAKTAHRIFRVSDRRRAQVPAVAFLINVLANSLPHGIKEAHFCQGGVREGVLFQELPQNIRQQQPLEVATAPYARSSASAIAELLLSSIPQPTKVDDRKFPESIGGYVIRALANVLYVHSVMSKETSSTAALYSTSTGLLSTSHGISHSDRAILALILEERYDGSPPPREMDFKAQLSEILTPETVWWTRYIGKVGFLISSLYPAGSIDQRKPRVGLSSIWTSHMEKGVGTQKGLKLIISIPKVKNDPMRLKEVLEDSVKVISKVGKKKNWIGGAEGWGMKVEVEVVADLLS